MCSVLVFVCFNLARDSEAILNIYSATLRYYFRVASPCRLVLKMFPFWGNN